MGSMTMERLIYTSPALQMLSIGREVSVINPGKILVNCTSLYIDLNELHSGKAVWDGKAWLSLPSPDGMKWGFNTTFH